MIVNITPFVVPFDRNARFIGREAQLSELREELFVAASTKKVAIAGPSGAGKTQLALELAYRTRQELQGCSVFWITARNKESVHQSCTQIARRLQIPGWDNGKADIKNLVQLHLSQEALGQWLLIIDNVDESEQESAGPFNGAGLMEFLPSSGPGAIVFTTTDRKTAVNLAAQHIVGLQEMDRGIARRMLESSLANPTNEQEKADLLLKELAYLPLAISQAAAYINVNKLTLQQYLSLLLKQKEDLMDLPPQESENVIAATWIISFEQIRRHETLAADYLLFMACVDRNDVPLSLLPAALPREKGMHAVEALNAYSLVTKRTAESALDLHQLVQLSTRNWLQQKGLLGQQTQAAITRLVEVYPDHRHGSRSKWRRLLPHARFALSSGPTGQNYEARVDLVWKCAMTLYSDGRWKEAEELYVQVVEIRKRVLGEEHPDTVASLANLAATYWSQGQWKEAEELFVQVVEIRKVVLGIEHPHTLTSMTNLSSTYRDQGRWKEAEELDVQLVEISSRVFGEHPNTMMSMANLASTYSNQGRWREAEELDVQVMEMFKRELGEEHPLTLSKIADLASTYLCQGRWKEAEELFIHVMETSRRVLGEDHPDTLPSMANLASTYKIQGRWKEAEQLEVQVIEGFRRILGEEHPYTLTSMSHLASTYRTEGRWKEAEELDLQVIETGKRVFGQEHPKMLTSIANLASTYWCQGRWKEAEELNSQVLATRKRVIGEDHPDTLTSMANLASTYRKQGRWKEAEDLFMQVIEIRKVVLGTEHPDTLTSMANLAETLKAQNRNQEAISMIELCFQLRKRVLGGHHPDTESSLGTLTRWQMETMELSH
jgi:tetratricopeptide (TPR) repeat protein